jgi:dCMP deaminase
MVLHEATMKKTKLRPDIDEYFLKIAKVVGERATCVRRKIGAVAVLEKHILATGYNGAPAGITDCLELGCLRDQQNVGSGAPHDICRSVHAEQNVITQAALHGTAIKGATVYCTTAPCALCARMLVNAEIKRYVCFIDYPNKEARYLFRQAGIKFEVHEEPSFSLDHLGEQVLAIPEKTFKKAGVFVGWKKASPSFYKTILGGVKYLDRDKAEKDHSWKQVIPYVIIHNKDNYLVMQRLPRSGEKRLHNAYTFGVGGHINPTDSTADVEGEDVIERGMMRELNEEVWVDDLKNIKLVGFIYDDKQEVSRHHLGFVYTAETGAETVKTLEPDKLRPFFIAKKDLPKYIDGKENWAEIVYEGYIKKG